jgi:SAM-dependent methyltransferase
MSRRLRVGSVQPAADWDAQWVAEPLRASAALREGSTPRWRAQERVIDALFGGFSQLRVIEIGSGRGLNGLLYALRGAAVTLLDQSPLVLRQARELYAEHEVTFDPAVGDVLELPRTLYGRFDVSMSFGLCEHFVGDERAAVVRAHLELVRPGGVALLGVPNRLAPFYRLWMAVLRARGTWPLGTEVPFSPRELATLARRAGGEPLHPAYGSFVASAVGHGLNQLLFKLDRRGVAIPQARIPLLDRFAYELLLPVVRPRRTG